MTAPDLLLAYTHTEFVSSHLTDSGVWWRHTMHFSEDKTFGSNISQIFIFNISSISSPALLVSCLPVSVQNTQWQHLKGVSFQPCTEEIDSPANYHHPQREIGPKRDGEGKRGIKGTKMETLLTFLRRAWLKSCLPSGVSWSNLLTNEKVFLSFFSAFYPGQVTVRLSLCFLWSLPCHCRWLVDGLKISVKVYMSPLVTLPRQPFLLFLFQHFCFSPLCWFPPPSLLYSGSSFKNVSPPSRPQFSRLALSLSLSLCLCHVSIRQLSAVHVRVRRTVKQTQGSSGNQSLRELTQARTQTHTHTHRHTHTQTHTHRHTHTP